MHPNGIQRSDLIEVRIGDEVFEATVLDKQPKVVQIAPTNPITFQRRYCDYTQIVRVIDRPGRRGMTHLLDDARGQMREGHTSSQWELIAREKVMRTLLETGEFTADALEDLNVPVEYRRHVHGAATGYFSGAEPYMEFVELRKSERPSRKGGKNQLFRITARGRRELPRKLRDLRTELTQLGPISGLDSVTGKGERHEVESVHDAAPSTGRGSSFSEPLPRGARSSLAVESGDQVGVGPHAESDKSGAVTSPPTAATDAGSPDSLVQLGGARRAPSMFDPWEGQAA